jgi:cytochrome P450
MMLATIIVTLLALPTVLVVWSAQSLYANKRKAQATGLPLLVRWVSPINPLWMIFGSGIVHKCRALGIGTKNFHRFYMFGWEGNERHLVHQELGSVFMLVSPGGIWMIVNDAQVMAEVIQRRADFRRNMEQFAIINVYGKNLATTDDEEWQKHRKVTAITFTEKNNELVWQQSLLQAQGMLEYWVEKQPIDTLAQDTKVFTLNVLAAAIFNKVYPFEADAKPGSVTKDNPNAYRDSLGKILKYIIPIFVWGEKGLQAWWVPKSWKAAGAAVSTFRDYVAGLIQEEREMMLQGAQKNQHLVAALVRACENDALEHGRSPAGMRNMTLTEQEIISNLFVYAFAGNDTTAVALTSLLVHLAAFPETQEWIAEELQHYLVEDDASQWTYSTCPKLKRCLAVVVRNIAMLNGAMLMKGRWNHSA